MRAGAPAGRAHTPGHCTCGHRGDIILSEMIIEKYRCMKSFSVKFTRPPVNLNMIIKSRFNIPSRGCQGCMIMGASVYRGKEEEGD